MNIEESIIEFKKMIERDKDTLRYWKSDTFGHYDEPIKKLEKDVLISETLLTAYEKEKEKSKNLEIELEIKKYCKVNELASDLIYYKNLAREYQGNCISKDKLKEIVDECIPKKENIITRELEYTPNANANSYLTQEILSLLKEE